jgi:hypothetical protein
MGNAIVQWFKSKGGFAHVVAGAFSTGVAAYAFVPPFHAFVIDVWAKTPPLMREAGFAAVGLYAWYTKTQKE